MRSIVAQLARRVDVHVRAIVDRRRIVYQQMNAGLPELGRRACGTSWFDGPIVNLSSLPA